MIKLLHIKILLAVLIGGLVAVTVVRPEMWITYIAILVLTVILAKIDYKKNNPKHMVKRGEKIITIGISATIISTALQLLLFP